MKPKEFFESLVLPHVRSLRAYTSARSEFLGEADLLDANEYPFAHPGDELQLHRYPEPQPTDLKRRLADLYDVGEDQLLLCRGADEAIELLVMATASPGTCLGLHSSPTYGMYQVSADSHGTHLRDVPMRHTEDGFAYDVDALCAAWPSSRGKLVFICTPNNPTGGVTSLADIERLCRELLSEEAPGLVVIDEAYIEFSDAISSTTLLHNHPNLVVLRTLSKAWGMAGARLGTAIAHPDLLSLLRKLQAPYPISRPSQAAVSTRLGDKQALEMRIARIKTLRASYADELSRLPCVKRVYPSQGNFILMEVDDAAGRYEEAKASGVVLRNRHGQVPNHLRVSIAGQDSLERIVQAWS